MLTIADIDSITQLLCSPLPGREAQMRMGVSFRRNLPETTPRFEAGVMLLLYPNPIELYTVFMQRPSYNGAHGGQISFPGGRFEVQDRNMVDTALRETEEEFGIMQSSIQILGQLTPLYIPVSETKVYPTVGFISQQPNFKIDTHEVEHLIECPLSVFSLPNIIKQKAYSFRENEGTMPYFDIYGKTLWGATAMIMNEFLELIKPIQPAVISE